MERFVGPDAGETRDPAGGVPVSAEERPPEWIDLAADIRAVDGNHDLGAGALAAALTARGWTRVSVPTEPGAPDPDRPHHTTHVCRDCGAEITLPYVSLLDEPDPESAAALVRVFDAMSRYDAGLVTLPHVRGVAGIGSTFLTEAEFKALVRLVDRARDVKEGD